MEDADEEKSFSLSVCLSVEKEGIEGRRRNRGERRDRGESQEIDERTFIVSIREGFQ